MSQPHCRAARQPRPVPGRLSNHPELDEQLARFQAATQDLLDAYELAQSSGASSPAGEPPVVFPLGGEIRSFYFSPAMLRHEKNLLRKYRAEGLPDLLAEIHMLLNGVLKLMKNAKPDARVRGCVLVSFGRLLEQVCDLAQRLRGVYGEAEQVNP